MSSQRRIGSERSKSRSAILMGAIEVLQHEGAAGLTANQIAKAAGVKPHLVHYYFRSIDDLIAELVSTLGAKGMANMEQALESDEPLRALWDIEISTNWGVAAMELATLALHRDEARAGMMHFIEEVRRIQAKAIERHFELQGRKCPVAPLALAIMIVSAARQIVREKSYGVTLGHAEILAGIEGLLEQKGPDQNLPFG